MGIWQYALSDRHSNKMQMKHTFILTFDSGLSERNTVNTLYTDIRYNDKIRYNGNYLAQVEVDN